MSSFPAATILAVDDEVLVLELIQSALEDGGYEVRSAVHPDEAFALLDQPESRELAGLVTDINLRAGRSGWDVAARAREINPHLPVVYVTGDSAHEWPSKGVPHSVVVTKPFAASQIVVALASLANRSDV